jgi:predicted O-linked N-acetylglucosamine transferase (SPINDLY family)
MSRGPVANSGRTGASPASALFHQAVLRMRAGDPAGAQVLGREVLQHQPRHPGALQLLAQIALRSGHTQAAIDLLLQVSKSHQDTAVLTNLGNSYLALGDLAQAEKFLRRAVAQSPDLSHLHFQLGNVLHRQARLGDAAECYRRSLRLEPRFPEALVNLSNVLSESGKADEAELPLREAMMLAPERWELDVNLGNLLRSLGRSREAERCYRRALEMDSNLVPALVGLGSTLEGRESDDEASRLLSRALELEPANFGANLGLAAIHFRRKQWEPAVTLYRRALQANPVAVQPWLRLSEALERAGQTEEAEACFQRLVALKPSKLEDMRDRAHALYLRGEIGLAFTAWRQVLQADPENVAVHSALVMLGNYDPALTREALSQQHVAWGRRHADKVARESPVVDTDGSRRLRVGYVSSDFRLHSVAYFIEPVLAHHDHDRFEIHCYSGVRNPDEVTRLLQGHADVWHDIFDLSDAELARRIADDGIDLLLDLGGHTYGNRLLAFARKPAPLQLTWIGYPNTTGMSQIDYRLTDALADPPGQSDRLYAEKLVRLPGCFCVYQPPRDAPNVAPLPLQRRGHVTFGCFNNPCKLNPAVLDLWARILSEVPGSTLVLKGYRNRVRHHLDEMRRLFSVRGIDLERILLWEMKEGSAEHLACYGEVDIALDPFPYNGVTTTCEALWMGVPVITLAGDRHSGRTGLTLLTHAGVGELAASSPDEYVRLAVELAGDRGRLEGYRSGLRPRMGASPMTNAPAFTQSLEAVYRALWEDYCGRVPRTMPTGDAWRPAGTGRESGGVRN